MQQSGFFLSGNIYPKVLRRSALGHDFYSASFLPDIDRVWHAISPHARREILKRLLELNNRYHGRGRGRCETEEDGKADKSRAQPGAGVVRW